MAKTLFERLQNASSEEDVKDIYIDVLGLKRTRKNLIDIQTKEIWFETKKGAQTSVYEMFTQLLCYVFTAHKKGEEVPPFLCVMDCVKAAIMETVKVLPFLIEKNKTKEIDWGKSASKYTREALETVSAYIGTRFVAFQIETQSDEFIKTVKNAVKHNKIIRTQITPDNLKQVFDRWVDMIGREIGNLNTDEYSLLFYADIMSDGKKATHQKLPAELIHKNNMPAFLLKGCLYEIGNQERYQQFWAIYDRPPEQKYRDYLLERRDCLIPVDERDFKGAFYTPLHIVDKAYELLAKTLGKNWQRNYIVWDMCCGVGNLETKHSNPRNLFMSTLEQNDVDIMTATKTCVGAYRFQYDYLNDDVADDGKLNYSLTNKLPAELQTAIQEKRKILILINPPYAEATNADNTTKGVGKAKNKTGVAKTKFAENGMPDWGKASNELFMQFVARIAIEIPDAVLAMFSTLKYVNAPNFENFRKQWNAEYLNGFIVHSKAFDGLKGDFPIGFLIWKTRNASRKRKEITEISTEILSKNGEPQGEKKFYNIPSDNFLSHWIKRPKANKTPVVPLKSAIAAADGNPRVKTWADNAVGYMCAGTNDVQNAQKYVYLLSSAASRGNGFYVTKDNLRQAAVLFSVEHLVKHSWVNDRDQFLQPDKDLPDEFFNDCLVYMLFNASNFTASVQNLEWSGQNWLVINHFIPYSEIDVGAENRFKSDFMVKYMKKMKFSGESKSVLNAGKKLWKKYFELSLPQSVKQEFKLENSDAGWFQIRNALRKYNETTISKPVDFSELETAYKQLEQKLRPAVYEYGFMK